jgi:hypothetical protein
MSRQTPQTWFQPYRAILAGFCGSMIALVILLFAYIFAQILGKGMGQDSIFYSLAYNDLTRTVSHNLLVTLLIHFVLGITFALAYAKIANGLPGHNSWKSGILFGLGLWLLSAIVFFPLVGAGFFALSLGAGLAPVAGSLVLHLVYGSMLGLVYSPYFDSVSVNRVAQQGATGGLEASPTPEKAAALGILGGAGIGAVLALVGWLMAGHAHIVSGVPLDYALLALVFFCIGAGMLVGFWTGAPERGYSERIIPKARV